MAAARTPKSILKKTPYPYPAHTSSQEERNREIALYHANLIQQRKDIELEILLSTEELIDFPLVRGPSYSASNPSPSDTQAFKTLLEPFQPSNYDELLQERNINENCGYALCPRPRLKDGKGGEYRLVGSSGRAKDFKIMKREDLEKWCSQDCARRALYVRVQLSETPAWERGPAFSAKIDLLDEPKSEAEQAAADLEKLSLSHDEAKKQGSADLAMERGDRGMAAEKGKVDVMIREKDVHRPAEPPSMEGDLSGRLDNMHLSVEGHTISLGTGQQYQKENDMDEDAGNDWL
ncbi:hypothetical protein BP5796_05321 [Coleophoma crateriformis]|uniref:RNA polymerase II subunit B1 CTD phosphatase RPAP2 homolog n=1 Tax=Coleophoma crateriformis TaxID=565419 RepID=A0A3D8S2U3_9HELO|nr:hypothetical protein BP5796_05321 [Coleophoma crateriformis]